MSTSLHITPGDTWYRRRYYGEANLDLPITVVKAFEHQEHPQSGRAGFSIEVVMTNGTHATMLIGSFLQLYTQTEKF